MAPHDLDGVLAIEHQAFASPWKREHFLHELQVNPYAACWVLRDAGAVVAYACVWHVEDEMWINNIAVHPDHQRRGLGRWMLCRLIEEARRRGDRRAGLEVRPSNAPALALYRELGFVQVGRRKNYYRLEREDALVMERPL
ncbi:MAG TPA: ribosomal protein S18-alanine N-acetyltransferase [Candidatus Polarisedimenticolaceae bacterium]|nr:ribosomal protein S18-alanine N-acetyltransferase [Candidatus Polarisedimenticolaceae bacterium]